MVHSASLHTQPGSAKTVADILTAAADLIEPEGAWTQGQCARGEDESWPCPEDDSATCWCGVGAVMRIAYFRHGQSSPAECEAIERLHAFSRDHGLSAFAEFNDAPERTQAEVVAALRAAAEKARATPSDTQPQSPANQEQSK